MKKILSILFSLFISLFNNIGYQQQNEVVYGNDKYFKIESEEEVDYRQIYDNGPTTAGNNSCHPEFFYSNGRKVILDTDESKDGTPRAYWLIDNETMKMSEITADDSTITVERNVSIIAPVRCKIKSSSKTASTTNDIQLICTTADGNKYTIQCENLERWWCCYGRTVASSDDNDIPQWEHTCPECAGKTIAAGQVIGHALGGKTTITITPSNRNDSGSIREFYQSATQ